MKTHNIKTYILPICIIVLMLNVSCSKDEELNEELSEEEITEITESTSIANEILQIVNTHRQSIGKNTLTKNLLATDLANAHTKYMIAQNDINHDDFSDRSNRLIMEENASSTGENVAFGQRSAKQVMDAWLNSPGHRRNIEGDFTHIGIGVIKNDAGAYYFTQIFLKKRSSAGSV